MAAARLTSAYITHRRRRLPGIESFALVVQAALSVIRRADQRSFGDSGICTSIPLYRAWRLLSELIYRN